MPVNGPSGVGPPRTTPTTRTETEPVVDTTTQPLTNTEDVSSLPAWQPNRARGRAAVDTTAPVTSDAVMQAGLDRFKLRFESILGVDAMSLARGRTPFREGDTLTDQQQSDLVRATGDLLKDVPIGRFSPEMSGRIQGMLRERGINRDVATTRLGDLGDIGGDIAKQFANELRHESPATFYGIGASAAATLGYMAWNNGSEGLRSLGVRPQVSSRFFGQHVRVGVGADFDARFTNVRPNVSTELNFPGQQYGRPDFRLGAEARFDANGRIDTMTSTASMSTPTFNAAGQITTRGNQLETAAGSFTYTPNPNFALSGGAMWSQPDRRLTAGVEAAWRLSRDVDFAVSATHDNQGESRVGVGARIRLP